MPHNHDHHAHHVENVLSPKDVVDLVISRPRESEVEITGDIPIERLASYRTEAIAHMSQHLDVPGFRKGHIPEKIIVERAGEVAILFEATEAALQDLYPALLTKESLTPIGRPDITLTKLAPGNPVGFKITVALMPEVTLPDYKKIATEVMSASEHLEVTEDELAAFITEIQKRQNAAEKKTPEDPLPELTDAYVQALGDFKDVADFREKLKTGMLREKEARSREKKRIEVSDNIIAAATIPLPRILIESELDKMIGQFKDEVSRANLKWEDYLKQVNKTEADLRTEWEESAAKKAKMQLVLNRIAQEEHIVPEAGMVEHEVSHIKEHFKDADPDRLRMYVETMLTNEHVFQFLESQGKKQTEPGAPSA